MGARRRKRLRERWSERTRRVRLRRCFFQREPPVHVKWRVKWRQPQLLVRQSFIPASCQERFAIVRQPQLSIAIEWRSRLFRSVALILGAVPLLFPTIAFLLCAKLFRTQLLGT